MRIIGNESVHQLKYVFIPNPNALSTIYFSFSERLINPRYHNKKKLKTAVKTRILYCTTKKLNTIFATEN